MPRKLVILESPYAGDVPANIQYARHAARDCITRGEAPVASHLLYTQFLRDDIPAERVLGIECGLAWLRVADLQVFYTDHGWSQGMIEAYLAGRARFLPWEARALHGEPTPFPGTPRP